MGKTITTFPEWLAQLSALEQSQLPYALSLAVNDGLFMARRAVIADYPRKFRGGLNYLRRGLEVEKAQKKGKPIAGAIGEKTGYMMAQESGATKTGSGPRGLAVPTELARSRWRMKSGKMKKQGWPKRLIGRYKDPIAAGRQGGAGNRKGGTVAYFPLKLAGGRWAIFERDRSSKRDSSGKYTNGTFKAVYFYGKQIRVRPRWDFAGVVSVSAHRIFVRRLPGRLAMAVRTAR